MAKNLVELILLPPFSLSVLALIMLLMRKNRVAVLLMVANLVLAWGPAIRLLEIPYNAMTPPDIPSIIPEGTVIIVPTGGSFTATDGTEWPSISTVVRFSNALNLSRKFNLPIIVSGGSGMKGTPKESEALIARYPQASLPSANLLFIESGSRNTSENAEASAAIMRSKGFRHAILSTSYYHGVRAYQAFERAGIDIIGFAPETPLKRAIPLSYWVPSFSNLLDSRNLIQEYIGIVWYAFSALWK